MVKSIIDESLNSIGPNVQRSMGKSQSCRSKGDDNYDHFAGPLNLIQAEVWMEFPCREANMAASTYPSWLTLGSTFPLRWHRIGHVSRTAISNSWTTSVVCWQNMRNQIGWNENLMASTPFVFWRPETTPPSYGHSQLILIANPTYAHLQNWISDCESCVIWHPLQDKNFQRGRYHHYVRLELEHELVLTVGPSQVCGCNGKWEESSTS